MRNKKIFDWWLSSGGGNPDFFDAINSYRTVDRGVYVQRISTTHRVWSPINDEYAQFYDTGKEVSAADSYWNLDGGWGIMAYYQISLPDSTTGTYSGATSASSYTQSVNTGTATITFTGTGLKFSSFSDNRGGIWEFSLDGGAQVVQLSVYRASSGFILQNVFSGLTYASHTVVATFKGDDPLNVPSGGAGTSRGWICRDSVTVSNAGRFNKAFYIIGSSAPNCCHDSMTVAHTKYTIASSGSHKEFAFSTRAASGTTAVQNQFIPNHSAIATTKAAIFADVATDRTLKIDGGVDLLTSLTDTYTLAVVGTTAVLSEVYQGTNIDDDDLMLFNVINTYTWTQEGINIYAKLTALVDLYNSTNYVSMMDAENSVQSHVIIDGQEVDTTVNTGGGQPTLVATGDVAAWDGTALSIKKTGTDFEKSLCQAMRLVTPSVALKTASNPEFLGDVTWIGNGTRAKIYSRAVSNIAVPAGTIFEWNSKFTLGIVPDAYNTLV